MKPKPRRSPITTHVLDLAAGRPREGIRISLKVKEGAGEVAAKGRARGAADAGVWREIGRGVTDADGRVENLLSAAARIEPGTYALTFNGAPSSPPSSPSKKSSPSSLPPPLLSPFFPEITITFLVTDPGAHHHVPLLLSPFGYSTYRGS
jgi:hydroxyisourate hydrolase